MYQIYEKIFKVRNFLLDISIWTTATDLLFVTKLHTLKTEPLLAVSISVLHFCLQHPPFHIHNRLSECLVPKSLSVGTRHMDFVLLNMLFFKYYRVLQFEATSFKFNKSTFKPLTDKKNGQTNETSHLTQNLVSSFCKVQGVHQSLARIYYWGVVCSMIIVPFNSHYIQKSSGCVFPGIKLTRDKHPLDRRMSPRGCPNAVL